MIVDIQPDIDVAGNQAVDHINNGITVFPGTLRNKSLEPVLEFCLRSHLLFVQILKLKHERSQMRLQKPYTFQEFLKQIDGKKIWIWNEFRAFYLRSSGYSFRFR